jgi:NAD/NADP transhydrogenase alpha subunit
MKAIRKAREQATPEKRADNLAMVGVAAIAAIGIAVIMGATVSRYFTPEVWDAVLRSIP